MAMFSNGTFQTVTAQAAWSSEDTTVMVVNASGLARAVGPGGVLLRATFEGLSGTLLLSNEFVQE